MIDPVSLLLWMAAGAAVGAAVVIFWEEIRNFFIESFQRLPVEVQQNLQGVVSLAKAVDRAIIKTFKYYSYDQVTQSWSETVETKRINASEVPEHIRNRLKSGNTVDITDEVAKELQLHL